MGWLQIVSFPVDIIDTLIEMNPCIAFVYSAYEVGLKAPDRYQVNRNMSILKRK